MMNIYALLCLCASAISISLGASVFLINRKSVANRLFMLLMFANAYWAFCQFMMSQTSSFETAFFWSKVLTFWPFLVALLLHFTLAFTESDLLKNKLIYPALYLPALIFSLIDLNTNWLYGAPTLTRWGYTDTIQPSLISRADGVWAAILGLLALFLFAAYYYRVSDKVKKQQTKLVFIGFAIPVCISLLTDSVFPAAGFNFPVSGSIAGTITSLFVVYAMLRYELFAFRPEIAVENVFSTMADAVLLTDLQGTIVKVNRAVLQLSGCSEDEVLGKSISDVVQKAGVNGGESAVPKFMAKLRKERELRNLGITFHSKSGENKNGVLSCSMVCDGRGQDVGVAFVVHDVTEQKEMEGKLLKSERLASIGELAGVLGNDLRNPLNAIKVASYYLKTKYGASLDSKDRVMFESIESSIDYSNKIVNDLIDYSSEITLEPETATPESLVAAALAFAPPPLNIQVTDETAGAPEFQVDADRISRSFAGIIKNACEAMPEGGQLTIKTEIVESKVIFSFSDTGCGMTEQLMHKIWTPLFTTKSKGMGFSLAICRRIVEAHDGKITAQSQPKMGTTIRVELPLTLKTYSGDKPSFLS